MKLISTQFFNLELNENEKANLSVLNKIQEGLLHDEVFAYNIIENNEIIGFMMLKEFDHHCYFLWNFVIIQRFSNQGYGSQALKMLIDKLKSLDAVCLTTTLKKTNGIAEKLYSKHGFIKTSEVNEKKIHEVNMELRLK